MPIKVTIEYIQPDPDDGGIEKPLAKREFRITRVGDDHSEKESWDQEHTYAADFTSRFTGPVTIPFKHRYGDAMFDLVSKGIIALSEAGHLDAERQDQRGADARAAARGSRQGARA